MLRGVPFAGPLTARVSAFADISLCVPQPGYRGCEEGGWRVRVDGGSQDQGLFRWSDGPIRILGVWFGPDLRLERNWSEVQAKVTAQVGIWLSRRLSLKSRRRAPCMSSPWSFTDWLYFLCIRHVGWRFNDPSPDCSWEVQGRWFVDRPASNVRAMGSGYAWSGEPLACWKTCILGPILDGGRSVKGESDFSSLQVRPKGWRST